MARKGQPQKIQPEPGGGKTYVYTTSNIDQMATMGGGAWAKPDQVYYHINGQGVITEVNHYPYGKRSFIFPAMKAAQTAQAPVVGDASRSSPGNPGAGAGCGPRGGAPGPTSAAGVPGQE